MKNNRENGNVLTAKDIGIEGIKKVSLWRDVWKRLRRNRMAMGALFIVIVLILVAIFADKIAPYDYAKQNIVEQFQFPSSKHPLGTDDFGRDILSRLIYGARISLLVSVSAVIIGLVIGTALGACAGYFGGKCEMIIMRCIDVLMALPSFLLAVTISAALGTGLQNTAIAISIGGIPSYCRLMCANVMSLRNQEFVESARACGAGDLRILFKHILPNTLSPIIVESTLRIGGSILAISGLSFIGLGVQVPTPEWGSMLATGRTYIRDFWPMTVFPGLAIMITLFGFNLLGDGLRDALDPKLKR